ncbi:MAG TPA: inositol monophosphatase family protein, partial [Verrucomicrobiae bacterium]|nr:inositol monophosphatase family protein [Verrucomicrobiae bacterium]
ESIVTLGFSKTRENIIRTGPYFLELVQRVRKIRIMGSAALAMTYVASGRLDAYIENDIRLWDVIAGGLIIECAGGEFWHEKISGEHAYRVIATNGLIRKTLRVPN